VEKILIGGYILLLKVEKQCRVRVGSLGVLRFDKGYYAYVGSAVGGNITIEKRLNRYKKIASNKNGNLRWHIDYLLASKNTSLLGFIPVKSKEKIECKISKVLGEIADNVVVGFGSSDCKNGCKGHLYRFKANPKKLILKTLKRKGLVKNKG